MNLSLEENDFVKWYRFFFKDEKDLPCLKCKHEKIVACSRVKQINPGCSEFQQYLIRAGRKG